MNRTWSFCKRCEMYHISFEKNDFHPAFETHLTAEEKKDAVSFPIYKKEIAGMPKLFLIFTHPEYIRQVIKDYPEGVFDAI